MAYATEADLLASVDRAVRALASLRGATGSGSVVAPVGCPESAIRVLPGACDSGNLLTKIFRVDYYEQAQRELVQLIALPGAPWRMRELYLHAVQLWGTLAYQAAALRKIWAPPSFVTPRGPWQRGLTPAGPSYRGPIHANNFDLFTVDRNLNIILGALEPQASDGTGSHNMVLWDDAERVYPSAGAGPMWFFEMLRRADIGPRPERAGWRRLLARNEADYIDAAIMGTWVHQTTPCLAADGCWSVTNRPDRVKVRTGGQMVSQASQWARYLAAKPMYQLIAENGEVYANTELRRFAAQVNMTPAEIDASAAAFARGNQQAAVGEQAALVSMMPVIGKMGAAVMRLLSFLPAGYGFGCPLPMFSRTLEGACSTGIERGAAAAFEAGARGASTILAQSGVLSKFAPVQSDRDAKNELTAGKKLALIAAGAVVGLGLAYVVLK